MQDRLSGLIYPLRFRGVFSDSRERRDLFQERFKKQEFVGLGLACGETAQGRCGGRRGWGGVVAALTLQRYRPG